MANEYAIISRNALPFEQPSSRIYFVSNPALISFSRDDDIARIVDNSEIIAIDTEFLRERTYFARLCLVQIATTDSICCLDPLADDESTDATWQALMAIPWVLHSGRQDIEVIFQTAGQMPSRLFDTQVAAGLLGHQAQIGYAGLVSELFDVKLDKSHTRADWSQRPLNEQMLRYAAEDVEYLLPAYDALVADLEKVGRLDWALEDSADLLDTELYSIDPATAVGRLKGARNLRGASRRVAVRLAVWREREAIRSNRPRQWILKDAVMLEIADKRPINRRQLGDISGFPESTLRRAGDLLLSEIENALADNDNYLPPQRPDEKQKALLARMQKRIADKAEELGIAAEIIASKKELSAALQGDLGGRVFRGWRNKLIGGALLELLHEQL